MMNRNVSIFEMRSASAVHEVEKVGIETIWHRHDGSHVTEASHKLFSTLMSLIVGFNDLELRKISDHIALYC